MKRWPIHSQKLSCPLRVMQKKSRPDIGRLRFYPSTISVDSSADYRVANVTG